MEEGSEVRVRSIFSSFNEMLTHAKLLICFPIPNTNCFFKKLIHMHMFIITVEKLSTLQVFQF